MNKQIWAPVLAAIAILMLALPTMAQASPNFMPTGGLSAQPVGHYEFCQRAPEECNQVTANPIAVTLTRELWATLIDVNNAVNAMVAPLTDMDIWGVEEWWSYPVNGTGDCEDYVLEKRRMLIEKGIPAGNLLITVVRQPNGDGHAVLTVHTSLGDFVLDNLEPRVLDWKDTEYEFLKRQSARNSGMWVSIEDGRPVAVGSVSSNR